MVIEMKCCGMYLLKSLPFARKAEVGFQMVYGLSTSSRLARLATRSGLAQPWGPRIIGAFQSPVPFAPKTPDFTCPRSPPPLHITRAFPRLGTKRIRILGVSSPNR
jgi:hypothetical protein